MSAPGLRFRAFRAGLAAAASDAARALPGRAAIPILNAVRLTASEDGYVEVVGYDFDCCIRATVGAEVVEPGQALVPGRALAAFLSGMPEGTVDVEQDGAEVQVRMPRVRYGLRTLPAEDYPGLPDMSATVGRLPAVDLARALAKVAVSARPLVGVEWAGAVEIVASAERLTIAATDRYTVAVAVAPWEDGPAEPVSAQVAAKPLHDALRGMTGDVSVCIGDGVIGVIGPERVFTSRRLAVEYPMWRMVADRLPEPTSRVLVRADELAGAMARGSRVVSEDRRPVRLTASPDDGLTYDAHAEGQSSLDGEIDIEGMTGDRVVLGVDPLYLADALKAFGTSVVELGIRGPLKPLTVTCPDVPDDLHVIQPIKIQ